MDGFLACEKVDVIVNSNNVTSIVMFLSFFFSF